jgi:hypothetical protein
MFHEVSKEMNPPNAKVNKTWPMMNISKHKIESTTTLDEHSTKCETK